MKNKIVYWSNSLQLSHIVVSVTCASLFFHAYSVSHGFVLAESSSHVDSIVFACSHEVSLQAFLVVRCSLSSMYCVAAESNEAELEECPRVVLSCSNKVISEHYKHNPI